MRLPRIALVLLIAPLLRPAPLAAQPPSPTIPALFLSDIHLDPFADPAKAARLNAAPAAEWSTILAAPPSPTRTADSAALQRACPVRAADTDDALWRSALAAMHAQAAGARFATLSGDLLAHKFDCKFRTLLPKATHADYLAFTEKTIQYEISSLRKTLPGVPLYIAMGNNDSGCTDYALDPTHDAFLARIAPIVADALPAGLPASDRAAVLRDFAAGGYYDVPLAGVPRTRLIVLDDIFMSADYATCAHQPDPAPAAAQLAWLQSQLASARQHRESVWVMSHIPPGINLYATARKLANICAGAKPQMFLNSESLADILAANAGIIRLALFAHTHSDEMRLLTSDSAGTQRTTDIGQRTTSSPGVPVKLVPSITPINGNRPSFILARISPATATLADYTVIVASNRTGDDATWAPEYTYSTAYHQPAFNSASVAALITGFQHDPAAASPASQAYLRAYSPGSASAAIVQLAWPQYACSLDHDSAAAFTACACSAAQQTGAP